MSAAPTGPGAQPPEIGGVRRSFVQARGVRFHVTESGPQDGRPVIVLHGWPQHHWAYRDLLADPPEGLRIIAPDLPGYGWSGPAPHRWGKENVAADVLALADALGLDRFLLVGHDWGGFVGYLMVLQASARIDGYLALNIAHPWQTPRTFMPHVWRFLLYQPFVASIGAALQTRTNYLEKVIFKTAAPTLDRDVVRVYSERFRDPSVARAARDTYRTFLTRELPATARHGERRRATVRSARSSAGTTPPSAPRSPPKGRRSPTTTGSRSPAAATSSSTSAPIWFGPDCSRSRQRRSRRRADQPNDA